MPTCKCPIPQNSAPTRAGRLKFRLRRRCATCLSIGESVSGARRASCLDRPRFRRTGGGPWTDGTERPELNKSDGILVTGAAGLMGSVLVDHLRAEGYETVTRLGRVAAALVDTPAT